MLMFDTSVQPTGNFFRGAMVGYFVCVRVVLCGIHAAPSSHKTKIVERLLCCLLRSVALLSDWLVFIICPRSHLLLLYLSPVFFLLRPSEKAMYDVHVKGIWGFGIHVLLHYRSITNRHLYHCETVGVLFSQILIYCSTVNL